MSEMSNAHDVPSPPGPLSFVLRADPVAFSWTVGSLVRVLTPFSHSLLAQVRDETSKRRRQLTVVLAQAACERQTENAFVELMRHRKAEALRYQPESLTKE